MGYREALGLPHGRGCMAPKARKHGVTPGTLYVVSTPIGNLEDITLRALRVLEHVTLIAAESRDHTRKLLSHYSIKTPVTSYNAHNQRYKGRVLLDKLKSGLTIALVSDAGTPGLSDPGIRLIRETIDANIPLVPVPGVSAALTALSVAGLPTHGFVFVGFLSNKGGRRRKELESLKDEPHTMVFFESPHRLIHMLNDVLDILGDREIAMAKEMTKVFEEVKRGPISGILAALNDETVRGEYTVVVAGHKDRG